jgi:AcrR family transcriptional regulator
VTRARLLEAAAAVFSERGFEAASLDEVATEAGLTKGAIYSSFSSKEDLFFEVLEARTQQRLAGARLVVGDGGPAAAGHALGERLAAFTADDPMWHLAFLEFWAASVRGPRENGEELRERRREFRDEIADELVRAGVDEHADQLAVLILALSNGLAVERAIDAESADGVFAFALERLVSARPASESLGLAAPLAQA